MLVDVGGGGVWVRLYRGREADVVARQSGVKQRTCQLVGADLPYFRRAASCTGPLQPQDCAPAVHEMH